MALAKIEPFAVEQVSVKSQIILSRQVTLAALLHLSLFTLHIARLQCFLTVLRLCDEHSYCVCSIAGLSLERATAL